MSIYKLCHQFFELWVASFVSNLATARLWIAAVCYVEIASIAIIKYPWRCHVGCARAKVIYYEVLTIIYIIYNFFWSSIKRYEKTKDYIYNPTIIRKKKHYLIFFKGLYLWLWWRISQKYTRNLILNRRDLSRGNQKWQKARHRHLRIEQWRYIFRRMAKWYILWRGYIN